MTRHLRVLEQAGGCGHQLVDSVGELGAADCRMQCTPSDAGAGSSGVAARVALAAGTGYSPRRWAAAQNAPGAGSLILGVGYRGACNLSTMSLRSGWRRQSGWARGLNRQSPSMVGAVAVCADRRCRDALLARHGARQQARSSGIGRGEVPSLKTVADWRRRAAQGTIIIRPPNTRR